MDTVFHDIFRAVHEGKGLSIAYRNQEGEVTRYWIGIRDLDTSRRTLSVEGFHLVRYTVMSFDAIYLDSILSSQVIEGSYYPVPQKLVTDIRDRMRVNVSQSLLLGYFAGQMKRIMEEVF